MTLLLGQYGRCAIRMVDQYPSSGLEKWTTNFWPSLLVTQQPGDLKYRTLILEIDKKQS